jgi:hypothetical protein
MSSVVEKLATELGGAETALHKARASMGKIERLLKEARKEGLGRDSEVMLIVSRIGAIAGQIAAAELGLYEAHADMTAKAIAKGVDIAWPLKVLERFQPETSTRDSGGGR